MFLRTRPCPHFLLTERSHRISVFSGPNHLSEWKVTCWIIVLTIDVCIKVRTDREREKGRDRDRERRQTASRVDTLPASLIQGLYFKTTHKFRQMKEWVTGMQVALVMVIFLDVTNTCLIRNACGPQHYWAPYDTHLDKKEEHLKPHACRTSIFYEPKPFYRTWIDVRNAVLATTCQPSWIHT